MILRDFDLLWKNFGTMEKNYGTMYKNNGTMEKKTMVLYRGQWNDLHWKNMVDNQKLRNFDL